MAHCCFIVPPYLLAGIADSEDNDEGVRISAREALAMRDQYTAERKTRLAALTAPRGQRATAMQSHSQHPSIVPNILLQHIADSPDVDEETRACAKRDLEHIQEVQGKYQEVQAETSSTEQHPIGTSAVSGGKKKEPPSTKFYRAVYDAKHSQSESRLPGTLIRAEGQAEADDKAVNEAYSNVGSVLEFYKKYFNWQSIDNKNMHVISSVHFGVNYENAFWDPEQMQMVFGDGYKFLHNFTGCSDVIGHELTHAVTEHTSPLDYQGQSGALNEHCSDVFGIMVKQMIEDEKADVADWLIGEGCLLPDVKGVALRSMKAPGTAYDDPRFGKDPQPDNFKDYKATFEDNGGVHMFSGIPNKAFYLAAVKFGGYSWEKAGQIWWKTMNSGQIPARCTFIQFADVTVEAAEELYGDDAAKIVRDAWNEVGVVRKTH